MTNDIQPRALGCTSAAASKLALINSSQLVVYSAEIAQNVAPSARHQTSPEEVLNANNARSWAEVMMASVMPCGPDIRRVSRPPRRVRRSEWTSGNRTINAALATTAQSPGTVPRLLLNPKNTAVIIARTAAANSVWHSRLMPRVSAIRPAPGGARVVALIVEISRLICGGIGDHRPLPQQILGHMPHLIRRDPQPAAEQWRH